MCSLMQSFTLAKWLKNPHLQTLGSVFVLRAISRFPSQDRLFDLPDGSKLVAECSWQKDKVSAPTLIIIPGLNGSTVSSYVRGTAAKAYERGFNVVRLNLRNGGNNEKYSRTLLHAGQSTDLKCVVDELIREDHLSRIGLIGFSFGGNICLKAAGEWGKDAPKQLIGVVGISPLVDLAATADSIDQVAPTIYRWLMLRGMKLSFWERSRLFPGKYNTQTLSSIKKFRDFDDFTAPYNGFQDAKDYYAQASALPLLAKIAVATLIIQADDDVVIPTRSFGQIHNNNIQLIITRGGGHGGFISKKKKGDPDRHWAENRTIEFLFGLSS